MRTSDHKDRLDSVFAILSDELRQSGSVYQQSRDRLLLRMRKRAGFVNPDLEPIAIQKFLATNDRLKDFRHSLDSDVVSNARHFIAVMLERYTTSLSDLNIQETLDRNQLYENWRFGPGASNGIPGTHTADKLSQPMTCTARGEPYVRRLRALNNYLRSFDGSASRSGVTLLYGSRLTTVPKNEETVRTIAIEPSGNMCMQLAAGRYLEEAMRMIGLDIRTQQTRNRDLACRGSIDGSLCTVDLSSASDLISIDLVRALMPPPWFELLMDLRSPSMMVGGEIHDLNMISTMGNGFTFPLMTLLIVSLIYAYRCSLGGPNLFISWDSTAVFGDDIIVPTSEYGKLVDVLTKAGFIVNHDKSYSLGPFRESCGGDYEEGVDITPFYIRDLHTDSDIYVVLNQLLSWSAKNNFFPLDTARLLISMLKRGPYFVPEWFNPDQGIKTSQVFRTFKYLHKEHPKVTYNGPFSMMLACGGYLEAGEGPSLCYTPRSKRSRVMTRVSRLPKGYMDGADPTFRSVAESAWVATVVALIA